MKISDLHLQSITVKHGKVSQDLFSDLRPGDKITAKITGREGNTALLEFRGRSISADFIAGVPQGSTVDLILSEKTPDRIAFTIAGKAPSDEFVKLLLSMSLLSRSGLEDIPVHNLMKFLGNGKIDLFTLNLFLAGIKKDSKEGKSATGIFNSLLKRGIPFGILEDLSYILAGRGGAALVSAYYSAAGASTRDHRRPRLDNIEEKIDDICKALGEDGDSFTAIIDLIACGYDGERVYGEIPFPDGESFSRLRYLFHGGAYLFDMEFSSLGRITSSIRNDQNYTFVSIFSDNEDIISFLMERRDILKRNLELVNVKKPVIAYYNSKKMIDKLDIWRTDFYIKREFDVKV